jgi:hypothetical protein
LYDIFIYYLFNTEGKDNRKDQPFKHWYRFCNLLALNKTTFMKTLIKVFTLFFALAIMVSCTDTKKEEEETKVIVEEIESVEKELNEISEELEQDTKALEDALNDLEN